ncbi:MAG: HPP family protein [Planctomycetia bacterium]
MSGATPRAVGWASAGLLAGAAMALLGVLAILVRAPLLFPAIGASAAVVALAPLSRGSQPRSIVLGHLAGALLGWAAVHWVADGAPGGLAADLDARHAAAGALALGATVAALLRFDIPHPPAAATTMIVGMGLLPRLEHVLAIAAAAALLALFATAVQRLARRDAPWWSRP